jgi:hypothetical protein
VPTFLAFEVPLASDGRMQVRTLGDGLLHDVANEPDVDPPAGGVRVRLLSGAAAVVPVFLAIATPDPVVSTSSVPAALRGPQYPAAATAATNVPAAQVFLGTLRISPQATQAATNVPAATVSFGGGTILTPSPVACGSVVPAALVGEGLVLYPDPCASSSYVPVHSVGTPGAPFEVPAAADGFAYVRLRDGSTQEVANLPDVPAPDGNLLVRDLAGVAHPVPLWLDVATPDPAEAASRVPHVTLVFGIPQLFLTPDPVTSGARAFVASLDLGTLVLTPPPLADGARAFVAHVAQGFSALTLTPDPVAVASGVPSAQVLSAGTLTLLPSAVVVAAGAAAVTVSTGTLFLHPSAVAARAAVPPAVGGPSDLFLTPDAVACGAAVLDAAAAFQRFLTPSPATATSTVPSVNQVLKAKIHGIPAPIESHSAVPAASVVFSGPHSLLADALAVASAVPVANCFQWTVAGPVVTTKTRAPGQTRLEG